MSDGPEEVWLRARHQVTQHVRLKGSGREIADVAGESWTANGVTLETAWRDDDDMLVSWKVNTAQGRELSLRDFNGPPALDDVEAAINCPAVPRWLVDLLIRMGVRR